MTAAIPHETREEERTKPLVAAIGVLFGALGGVVFFVFTYWVAGIFKPAFERRLRTWEVWRFLPEY